MTAFADSSALVKLYTDEPESDAVRALGSIIVSAIARVEVASALWAKHRAGLMSAQQARLLVLDFVEDFTTEFATVGIAGQLLARAAALVPIHGLRAGDAIQLASAVAAREADPGCTRFACFDDRLRDAAAAEGFAVLP